MKVSIEDLELIIEDMEERLEELRKQYKKLRFDRYIMNQALIIRKSQLSSAKSNKLDLVDLDECLSHIYKQPMRRIEIA